jgi:hypothetical protein
MAPLKRSTGCGGYRFDLEKLAARTKASSMSALIAAAGALCGRGAADCRRCAPSRSALTPLGLRVAVEP